MATLEKNLSDIVGDGGVVPQERLGDYAVDGLVPTAAVLPPSAEALSRVLALVAGEGWKVAPRGGGTQMGLGNLPRGLDLVLGVERLDRFLSHEPADLVATAEAGTTLASFQEQLGKRGQSLPLQAPMPSRATIGGILAANASGPSRLAYGTARDWLIGIRVAHADGTLTRSGGRVVKNVSGYDLNKLYTGSLGTLGIIVEATFKTAPLPSDGTTLLAGYHSMEAALDAARSLFDQSFTPHAPHAPHALHVLSGDLAGRLPDLAILPVREGQAVLLALYAGRARAVEKKAQDSEAILGRTSVAATERLDAIGGDALWQAVTDLGWAGDEPELALKAVLPLSAVSEFLRKVTGDDAPWPQPAMVVDLGYGMVRLLWWGHEEAPHRLINVPDVVSSLRPAVHSLGGHLVVERCPVAAKAYLDVWGDEVEGQAVMRRIKHELDPTGALNPGRFIGGI